MLPCSWDCNAEQCVQVGLPSSQQMMFQGQMFPAASAGMAYNAFGQPAYAMPTTSQGVLFSISSHSACIAGNDFIYMKASVAEAYEPVTLDCTISRD